MANEKKDFAEGEIVNCELSPYHLGVGEIKGKVEGIPDLDSNWWIVKLSQSHEIDNYECSRFVFIPLPEYRLNASPHASP